MDSAAWGFSSSWAANMLYCLDADGHWDSHAKGYLNYSLRLVCNVYYNGVRCMMISHRSPLRLARTNIGMKIGVEG